MRIAPGKTRFVIVLDRMVIKVARFRLLHILCFPVALALHQKVRDAWLPKLRKHGLWRLIWWKLRQGMEANRCEYELFLSSRDARLAPTLASYCFGLVNIQARGERVAQEELSNEHPFPGLVALQFRADAYHACQYARINGRIRLVDYGNPLVSELLAGPFAS